MLSMTLYDAGFFYCYFLLLQLILYDKVQKSGNCNGDIVDVTYMMETWKWLSYLTYILLFCVINSDGVAIISCLGISLFCNYTGSYQI